MLTHLRSATSRTPQRWFAAKIIRSISSTSVVQRDPILDANADEEEDGERKKPARPKDPNYKERGIANGCRMFHQPFPLNPSFKPPTPVSDALRTSIYSQFMSNPDINSVRNLAGRYHLSIKRVDAILRLKGLEEHWIKGFPLQTGFRHGMERFLGVETDESLRKTHNEWVKSRSDVSKADALDQVEGDDPARARYQRMFWEPVVEGAQPVLPSVLEQARMHGERHRIADEAHKSDDALLGRHHDSRRSQDVSTTTGDAPGRPLIKFVDVGGKFLDPKDRVRRMKESERRARLRDKKRQVLSAEGAAQEEQVATA
ncbi:hypothetical protein EW146_g7762 [Bondarzewia mesenterica]|uniref:Uncharacterized protein n=1 Tax=Bondarzewia mesenterica TaxID=1095465 RepID=A0A4S4LKB1_9AGAM|nr:hypothetical protein EW146_g7762 [Bondarzewia mesenterica]